MAEIIFQKTVNGAIYPAKRKIFCYCTSRIRVYKALWLQRHATKRDGGHKTRPTH